MTEAERAYLIVGGRKVYFPSFTDTFIRSKFRPYAVALGYVAYEWNRLHEELSRLFVALVEHSIPSEARSGCNSR